MKCFNCQNEGHSSKDCTEPKKERGPMKCFNCQGEGHSSKDCTEERKERGPMKCFNCQGEGHSSRDCPQPKKEGSDNCFNCKKPGHKSSECTEPRPDGEKPRERYIPVELEETEANLFHKSGVGINFEKQNEIPCKLTGNGSELIKPLVKFEDAKFSDLLMQNVQRSGYTKPTPVQKYAIPIMSQKRDIMACAQTGSGKTAAYLLPIMTNILADGIVSSSFSPVQEPQALILAPTRELAIQIHAEAKKFGYGSMIKCAILYGGADMGSQLRALDRGCNILVATPGRLLGALEMQKISLAKVKYFVLDEADRMIDQGFEPDVRKILTQGKVS
jgi:probable ATP-dependent RNA helicase DDX4